MTAHPPETLMGWTWLGCALALTVICVTLAVLTVKYEPRTARAVRDAAIHGDGLTGEARLAAKQSVIASQKSTEALENLNQTITDLDKLVWKFDDTADAATSTIHNVGGQTGAVLTAATGTIQTLGDDSKRLTSAMERSLAAMDTALAPLPDLERAATKTITAGGDFINNPYLNAAIKNWSDVGASTNKMVVDVHAWAFPPPYTGAHPTRHKFAVVGKGALKMAPPIINGLAGGIALTEGR